MEREGRRIDRRNHFRRINTVDSWHTSARRRNYGRERNLLPLLGFWRFRNIHQTSFLHATRSFPDMSNIASHCERNILCACFLKQSYALMSLRKNFDTWGFSGPTRPISKYKLCSFVNNKWIECQGDRGQCSSIFCNYLQKTFVVQRTGAPGNTTHARKSIASCDFPELLILLRYTLE